MKKSEREKITNREFEVLKHINWGHRTADIALYLGIKESTVSVHRKKLYKKLDIHSVWEVTQYCKKNRV